MERKQNSYLFLLLGAIIWGGAFVAQQVGAGQLPPFTFNAARFYLGGLVLLPVIALRGKKYPATRHASPEQERTLWVGGAVCGVLLALASNAQQIGIATTTVGKAGFITALYIVLVPLVRTVRGHRPSVWLWCGVVLAVGGLYLLCIKESFALSSGDIWMILCALLFTFQILAVDHFSPLVDGVRLSCLEFFTSAVVCTVMALVAERPTLGALAGAWLPLAYTGILSCGVAYTFQILGQRGTDPTLASLLMSLESVFSALAGWLVLHQSLTVRETLGCVLMFGAVLLAQLPTKHSPAPKT